MDGLVLLAIVAVLLLATAVVLYWLIFEPLNERTGNDSLYRLNERIENEYRYRENIARAYIEGSNRRAAEKERQS